MQRAPGIQPGPASGPFSRGPVPSKRAHKPGGSSPKLALNPWRVYRDIPRRIRMEFIIEWPLLMDRWRTILLGVAFQYVHAIAGKVAHYMHRPAPVLRDLGFKLLPELGPEMYSVSEAVTAAAFVLFVLWSFSPFVLQRKRFYTAVLYARFLTIVVLCQVLRILSFTVTQLPGPAHHCRPGQPTARLPRPSRWWQYALVNLSRQVGHSCGDLIFSSHSTFVLAFVLVYGRYGSHGPAKAAGWAVAAALGLLIVASRKHYTVDVVVAWYTVPLVAFWVDHNFAEPADRAGGPGGTGVAPTPLPSPHGGDEASRRGSGDGDAEGGVLAIVIDGGGLGLEAGRGREASVLSLSEMDDDQAVGSSRPETPPVPDLSLTGGPHKLGGRAVALGSAMLGGPQATGGGGATTGSRDRWPRGDQGALPARRVDSHRSRCLGIPSRCF